MGVEDQMEEHCQDGCCRSGTVENSIHPLAKRMQTHCFIMKHSGCIGSLGNG
jgi:hypothetical protein